MKAQFGPLAVGFLLAANLLSAVADRLLRLGHEFGYDGWSQTP